MRLHEEETLFRQAVTATAAQLNIPEIFIEKDYWVTYALHAIFHAQLAWRLFLRVEQPFLNASA